MSARDSTQFLAWMSLIGKDNECIAAPTWIYLFHKDCHNCQLDRLSIADLPLQKLQTSESNATSHFKKHWWVTHNAWMAYSTLRFMFCAPISIFANTETEWEILIETVDNIFETLREMQTQKNSVIKWVWL